MKVLIWIGCIIAAVFIQIFLINAGITGGLPALLLFLAMTASAKSLCKAYEEKKSKKLTTETTNSDTTESIQMSKQDSTD